MAAADGTSAADGASTSGPKPTNGASNTALGADKYGWDMQKPPARPDDRLIRYLPVASIRRPLQRTRLNDQDKVRALMDSIDEVGLLEPIEILEVDGVYYGFSGCHRFEAHQRLGKEMILCRVRRATRGVLRMHMM